MRPLPRVLEPSPPLASREEPEPGPDDWRFQLRHSIRSFEALEAALVLSETERLGARRAVAQGFPLAVTPYYLSLCDPTDSTCPIRRQVVPRAEESLESPGDLADPLGEEAHRVAPNLIRRYPDRALLLVADRCAVYCRFCTRSRLVGQGGGARRASVLGPDLDYLRAHPEVRDVIVSGGDPFVASTERLVAIVAALRGVASVETIRLATRVPVVLPQRVTGELLSALRPFHPLWVMTHFNHPKELTPEARAACERLADAGFPVMNHCVLLRGVNDDARTLSALFRGLVRVRVRPYYLLQADPVSGIGHLRTPLSVGVALMEELQGRLSGIALPKLIVDTPGGFGKVPVGPDYVLGHEPGRTRLRTPWNREVYYFDPE
ncbi:MAG TPA: KamA family radical SAM protein [Polyangiaceae bacterium]